MANAPERRSGDFVYPGSRLAVIEEFLPGKWTYAEKGNIHSMITGHMLIDIPNRTISVYPSVRLPLVPKRGSTVLGQVTMVREKGAEIRILMINKKRSFGSFFGPIHVSNVSESFVRRVSDAFKPGDLIYASVISTVNKTFHLSTEDREFGVVHALCSHCGHLLAAINGSLRCPLCKRTEQRKIASSYGKIPLNFGFFTNQGFGSKK